MSDFPINPTDLAIIAVVVLSGVFAMARGFVREVLSLASWIGAAMVTLWGFSLARPYARSLIANTLLADIAAGVILFIGSLIVLSMVGGGLASLIRGTGLNALDRTLGFLFGLLRGALIIAILWLAFSSAFRPEEHPVWIREARSLPLVERFADFLRNLAPPEFRTRMQASGETIGRRVNEVQQYRSILSAPATPQPKSPAAAGETGYKPDERRGLDGLIQRAQPAEPGASAQ